MRKNYKKLLVALVVIYPFMALGATGFRGLLLSAQGIVNQLVVIVFSLALLAFFWGLTKYIWSLSGDKKNYEEGVNIMKWGILTLFIMVSIWGIVGFIRLGFGL